MGRGSVDIDRGALACRLGRRTLRSTGCLGLWIARDPTRVVTTTLQIGALAGQITCGIRALWDAIARIVATRGCARPRGDIEIALDVARADTTRDPSRWICHAGRSRFAGRDDVGTGLGATHLARGG